MCYRRDDSADVTGRICDYLKVRLGENLIRDVDSIPHGLDFRTYLAEAVDECRVLLAVIGREWLNILNQRMQDPRDFVRIEIESALKRNIPIIPITVQGATLPNAEQLPTSMKDFAFRHGMPIRRDPDFRHDVDSLMNSIERLLALPAAKKEP